MACEVVTQKGTQGNGETRKLFWRVIAICTPAIDFEGGLSELFALIDFYFNRIVLKHTWKVPTERDSSSPQEPLGKKTRRALSGRKIHFAEFFWAMKRKLLFVFFSTNSF
jgi:hypothetical protein